MQKPPRCCPWISTAKSDLDSFLSARNLFCEALSLEADLRERLDEEDIGFKKEAGKERPETLWQSPRGLRVKLPVN